MDAMRRRRRRRKRDDHNVRSNCPTSSLRRRQPIWVSIYPFHVLPSLTNVVLLVIVSVPVLEYHCIRDDHVVARHLQRHKAWRMLGTETPEQSILHQLGGHRFRVEEDGVTMTTFETPRTSHQHFDVACGDEMCYILSRQSADETFNIDETSYLRPSYCVISQPAQYVHPLS